ICEIDVEKTHLLQCQVHYSLQLIKQLRETEVPFLDVTQKAMDDYNASIQKGLQSTVWSANCKSWYKSNKDGKIFALWPSTVARYWMMTRTPNLAHYEPRVSNPHLFEGRRETRSSP